MVRKLVLESLNGKSMHAAMPRCIFSYQKKGVRRGTTSSQADPAEDKFVDSWDEQIDFKRYREVQETFW